MDMGDIKTMAQDFSASSLREIAAAARQRSQLIRQMGGLGLYMNNRPVWDAADDFGQLARYCERIVALGEAVVVKAPADA